MFVWYVSTSVQHGDARALPPGNLVESTTLGRNVPSEETARIDPATIHEHDQIVGADDVHVSVVDKVEGDRIKLTKQDSVDQEHHYIPCSLVAEVEDGVVRLSANADVAIGFEE